MIDIKRLAIQHCIQAYSIDSVKRFAEAYHKLKCAEAEPFGIWHVADDPDGCDFFLYENSGDVACDKCVKLYTTPQLPKRLSDDDVIELHIKHINQYTNQDTIFDFANAIMDKMIEVNK